MEKNELHRLSKIAYTYTSSSTDQSSLLYVTPGSIRVRTNQCFVHIPLDIDLTFNVRGSDLLNVLKVFPSDQVFFHISPNQKSLVVSNEDKKTKVKVPLIVSATPYMPSIPTEWIQLGGGYFVDRLKALSKFARPWTENVTAGQRLLCFVYIDGYKAYATDSKSAAYCTFTASSEIPPVLINPKLFSTLTRSHSSLVGICVTESLLWLKFSDGIIIAHSIFEGNFPDLEKSIPQNFIGMHHIEFESGFLEAVKLCIASQSNLQKQDNFLALEIEGNTCIIESNGIWETRQELSILNPVSEPLSIKISTERILSLDLTKFHYSSTGRYIAYEIDDGIAFTMERR